MAQFPEYLTKNAGTLSPEDTARFAAQISCIKRLINKFEASTYRDEDQKAREEIVELMAEVRSLSLSPTVP